jgi:hypothetical protein
MPHRSGALIRTQRFFADNHAGKLMSPDGQWVARLLSVALASRAWVAWTLSDQPHLGRQSAGVLQVGSATADWVMWLTLAHQDVFSTAAAWFGVLASIPTHDTIGLLLVLAIRAASQTGTAHVPAARQEAPNLAKQNQAGGGFNHDSAARVEAVVSAVRRAISSTIDVMCAASMKLLSLPSRLERAPSKPASKSVTPS